MKRTVGYICFSGLWLMEIIGIAYDWDKFTAAPPLYWVLVAVGVVTIAHTVAFYNVGAWFRAPFTVIEKDTAGGIETVNAKPGNVFGELLSCPICAGAHSANLMLLAFAFNAHFGWALAASTAIATAAMMFHWLSEKWQHEARLAIEQHGLLNMEKKYGKYRHLVDCYMNDGRVPPDELERLISKNGNMKTRARA